MRTFAAARLALLSAASLAFSAFCFMAILNFSVFFASHMAARS
jgi:hypothetical protein